MYEPHTTTLRPGFEKFAEVRREIPADETSGWEVCVDKDGDDVFEIFSCVVVARSADSVRLGFKVIADGTQPFDEAGNLVDEDHSHDIFWTSEDYSSVWERRFNHVMQEL